MIQGKEQSQCAPILTDWSNAEHNEGLGGTAWRRKHSETFLTLNWENMLIKGVILLPGKGCRTEL